MPPRRNRAVAQPAQPADQPRNRRRAAAADASSGNENAQQPASVAAGGVPALDENNLAAHVQQYLQQGQPAVQQQALQQPQQQAGPQLGPNQLQPANSLEYLVAQGVQPAELGIARPQLAEQFAAPQVCSKLRLIVGTWMLTVVTVE